MRRTNPNLELVDINVGWLRQMLLLLGEIQDADYGASPRGLEPHRVGSHLRHVLEFYECFIQGLPMDRVDYDSRRRDESVENSRYSAAAKICSLIKRLEAVADMRAEAAIGVRLENAIDATYLRSTIGRELQAISSHTIHHFALIAMTLRMHGYTVDPDFGMSPSTLRYRASRAGLQRTEAA